MKDKRIKIVYCGLDSLTPKLLMDHSDYQVCGIVDIDDFNTAHPKNLFDRFFKHIYQLKKRQSRLTRLFAYLYQIVYRWSSFSFKKSSQLMLLICRSPAEILNLEELDKVNAFFEENKIDLIIVNNWWLLDSYFLDLPKYGVINLHPSRLPQYRGSVPTLWSLKNGDRKSALSFIKLNSVMDGGNIIKQYDFDILQEDEAINIENKIEALTIKYLYEVINKFVQEGSSLSQEKGKASYTSKYFEYINIYPKKENAKDIINKVNLYPYLWPFDFCYLKNNDNIILLQEASLTTTIPKGCSILKVGDVCYQDDWVYFMSQDKLIVKALTINS